MSDRNFLLKPFPSTSLQSDIQIAGNINRHSNTLKVCYQLRGNLSDITIAKPASIPMRKHELWKDTCFEFFMGIQNSSQYWEFNLSPAGHWNIYRFTDYRQGMKEETAFDSLPFTVETKLNLLKLTLELNLDPIIPIEKVLAVGITTVIKYSNGDVTYWALTHPSLEPDFHQQDSFIIKL